MSTGAFGDITDGLKNAYPRKAVEPMVNEETPFRRTLKKSVPSMSRVSEAIVKFGANLNPPQNQAQISDGAVLPPPKDRTQDQFTLIATLFPATFQIGWLTRRAANSEVSAFNGGELRRRTEETIADNAKFIEQTYLGTTGSGTRAEVLADLGSGAFTVKDPNLAFLLRENHLISLRTTDGGDTNVANWDAVLISQIVKTGGGSSGAAAATVTAEQFGTGDDPTAGAATPDSFIVVVAEANQTGINSVGTSVSGSAANGIRGLIDDGTNAQFIHGLDRTSAANNKLKAVVEGAGGTLRDLDEQILIHGDHEVRHRSGKRITDLWTNTGQVEKYIEFVAPDRRYPVQNGGVPQMGTGYQEDTLVHYAPGVAMKIQIGLDISPREIYGFNWDTMFHYVAQDMDWWDEGNMLKPVPTDGSYKAAFFAALASLENIGCDMPLGNIRYEDLKDPLLGDV